MLKLCTGAIEVGCRIILPELWHEKLVDLLGGQKYPYEYFVEEVKKKNGKIYVCVGEMKKGKIKEKVKIGLTELAIKYLLSEEIPDTNNGFSFKEYLPIEGTEILMTNVKNPSEVIPAILKSDVELIKIDAESLIVFKLKVDYSNGKGFANARYYVDGSKKSTWKFLLHEDESFMTDYEKIFRDTVIHKIYVRKSAEKLARYLENNEAYRYAEIIRQRARVHDDSKMTNVDEMNALSRIINDKSSLRDASKQLSPIVRDAIKLHHKNNSHHPEHYESVMDMSKGDIMEMCCDWHARSCQYGTEFLKFVHEQQKNRFHFPGWMFAEILHYCKVLNSKY